MKVVDIRLLMDTSWLVLHQLILVKTSQKQSEFEPSKLLHGMIHQQIYPSQITHDIERVTIRLKTFGKDRMKREEQNSTVDGRNPAPPGT